MYETIFTWANFLIMPFWLLMILLPFWGWTQRIMRSLWTVVPLALLYALLVLPNALTLLADLGQPDLAHHCRPAGHTGRGHHRLESIFWLLTCLSGGGPIWTAANGGLMGGWFRPSSFLY